MKKTLQKNSKYNDYDLDGDGTVTDEELENAKALLRAQVSFYKQDRYFGPDIEKSASLIRSAALNQFIPAAALCSF